MQANNNQLTYGVRIEGLPAYEGMISLLVITALPDINLKAIKYYCSDNEIERDRTGYAILYPRDGTVEKCSRLLSRYWPEITIFTGQNHCKIRTKANLIESHHANYSCLPVNEPNPTDCLVVTFHLQTGQFINRRQLTQYGIVSPRYTPEPVDEEESRLARARYAFMRRAQPKTSPPLIASATTTFHPTSLNENTPTASNVDSSSVSIPIPTGTHYTVRPNTNADDAQASSTRRYTLREVLMCKAAQGSSDLHITIPADRLRGVANAIHNDEENLLDLTVVSQPDDEEEYELTD